MIMVKTLLRRRLRFTFDVEVEATTIPEDGQPEDFREFEGAVLQALLRSPEALRRHLIASAAHEIHETLPLEEPSNAELIELLEPELGAKLTQELRELDRMGLFSDNVMGALFEAWTTRILRTDISEIDEAGPGPSDDSSGR